MDPVVVFGVVGSVWPAVIWAHGIFRLRAHLALRGEVTDLSRATLTFGAASLALLDLFKLQDVSRAYLLVLVPSLAIAIVSRVVIRALLRLRALSFGAMKEAGRR